MNKGLVAGIAVVFIGAASAVTLSAFAGKPTEYSAMPAKFEGIAQTIEVSGDIKGEQSTTYYANVTAPISSYSLKVGDLVKSNDIVLMYDTEDLEKALSQAELTAQSSENTMNGQIAASDKKAALYNQAVEDTNTYMGLYAVVRASNDQVDQSQYQENWDINSISDGINRSIAAKKSEIAEGKIAQSKQNEELAKKNEELTAISNIISLLSYEDEDYQKKYDALDLERKIVNQEIAQIKTQITEIETSMACAEKDIANLGTDLASLPPASLSPEEYAKEVVNGNWMSDIMRNWTQATTVKNAYEAQILNSYQKDQLRNSYDLSELSVENAQDNINKALNGVMVDYNGIVTESFVNAGSMASKGAPLFTIESSDDLKVEVGVSKYDIGSIAVGQRAEISIAGREYQGRVSEIRRLATVTDSDKAKVSVSVHIDNPDEYVYLGLEADVTIYANEIACTTIIPIDGYYADDDGDYCYLIKDDVIVKQYITTGIESDDYIEVLNGIKEGDIVITDAVTDDLVGKKAVAK